MTHPNPTASRESLGEDDELIRAASQSRPAPPRRRSSSQTWAWGYDNASFIYRVAKLPAGATANVSTLQLGSNPVDAFLHSDPRPAGRGPSHHGGARERARPGPAAPGSAINLVRCVAERSWQVLHTRAALRIPARKRWCSTGLCRVSTPAKCESAVLERMAGTGGVRSDRRHARPAYRHHQPGDAPRPSRLQSASRLGSGGQVAAPVGAYWRVVVRPSTPQGVYPEQLLVTPQPGPASMGMPAARRHRLDRRDCLAPSGLRS